MEQLGLGYIAASARVRGFSAEILDGFLEPDRYRERLETLHTGHYRLIGYPIYVESLKRVARDVATLRTRSVTTHVTVGNYVATLAPDDILRHYVQFDSVVRGEGEATVCDLLSALRGECGIDNVAGLSYRKDGEVRHNASRPNVRDIDTLPFPARDSLPLVLKLEMHRLYIQVEDAMLAASSVPFTATIPPRQTVYGEVVRPPTSSTRWNRCTNSTESVSSRSLMSSSWGTALLAVNVL